MNGLPSKYYAYRPRADGSEPMGTDSQTLFELKTDAGAIRRARRLYGPTAKVFRYWNVFDPETYREVTR